MPNTIIIHKAATGPLVSKKIEKPAVGRGIDLLVATSVLRLEVHEERWGDQKQFYRYSLGTPNYFDNAGEMILDNYLPPFSEDIKAAWEIFVRNHEYLDLRQHGAQGWGVGPNEVRKWSCYLKQPTVKYATGAEGHGDSASEAICLAALKAVGYYWE